MFCNKCGQQLDDHASVCSKCGAPQNVQPVAQTFLQSHEQPRCTCCGYVGEFKAGPLLTGSDWLWFFLLLMLAGAGFIFLLFKVITRGNPKNREKICPKCKSVNMYTYQY